MPKLKSHSGAKKRLWRTGGGRVAFKRRGRNHLLQQKSNRQKHLPRVLVAQPVNERALTSLAPYV